jgi:single-strand DNA-binding protein
MPNYHQTIAIGHLGGDPESRTFDNGDTVCNFSVAVTEKWTGKTGEKGERTTWYRVTAYRKLAEICSQYLAKGMAVMVVGRMQCRQYEKDGVKRDAWELIADEMKMLGSKSDSGSAPAQKPRQPAKPKQAQRDDDPFGDDQIPF